MLYDDIQVGKVRTKSEYDEAFKLLISELDAHEDTALTFYEFLLIAKKSNEVIGLITANRYLPKKAILCDIVVKPQYRSQAVAIKLLRELGTLVRDHGYEYLLGFTPKKNKAALKTYRRMWTRQEEQIITVCNINESEPHVLQMESIIRAREKRKNRRIESGKRKAVPKSQIG